MKKIFTFFPLMLVLLFVFACDLNFGLPKKVVVKGTPSLTLQTNVNISKFLSDIIMETVGEMDEINILECVDVQEQLTYIIGYSFDTDFSIPDDFLEEMITLVHGMVDEQIEVNSDLFDGLELEREAVEEFINSLMDGFDLDGLDLPDDFSWNGVTIDLDIQKILDGFINEEKKEAIIEAIMDPESGSTIDTVAQFIKDAVVETILEVIKTTDIVFANDFHLPGLDEPIALPLGDITDILSGFTFPDIKARLYLSVTDEDGKDIGLLGLVGGKISFSGDVDDIPLYDLESTTSGIDYTKSVFNGTDLPNPGIILEDTVLTLLNSSGDIEISVDVYIPQGSTFSLGILDKEIHISAELVVWLPLKVQATSADEFALPFELPDIKLITEQITSVEFGIEFNGNLFNGLTLTLKSGDLEFNHPITGDKLDFKLTEANIIEINKKNSFSPEVIIKYGAGASLQIPRNFTIKSIFFKAGLNIRMDI
ncbi:MAG: hypothetical protein FWD13_08670 [Treponema sp.]|nr:hypothetical protein [Treponema sp.]